MGSEGFLRAFAKSRGATADADIVNAAILSAETIVNAMLAASHGTPFADPAPQFVKDICVMLAPYEAVKFYPGNSGGTTAGAPPSPYKGLHDAAMESLKRLARDDRARLPSGASKPTSELSLMLPETTSTWTSARNGTKRTDF